MKTETTRDLMLAVAALSLASCTTNNKSSPIVPVAVLASVGTTDMTTGTTSCACPVASAGGETDFYPFVRQFVPCVAILNQMPNNGDGKIRFNTNDFVIDDVRLNYESTDSGTTLSIPEIVTPTNGTVLAASSLSVPTVLVPASIASQIPTGVAIRVRMIYEGHLLDGSKVKSSEYEYIFSRKTGTVSDVCND